MQPVSDAASAQARQVEAEQVAVLYRHQLPILLIDLAVAAALVVGLWGVVGQDLLIGWAGAVVAMVAWRAVLARRYARSEARKGERRWARLLVLGSAVSGAIWGTAGVLLFPAGELAYQIFVLFVLTGMGAGAVSSLTAFLPAFYAYLPLSLLPVASLLLAQGTRVSAALGAMTLVYLAALIFFGRTLNRSLHASLALRFENLGLVEELSAQKEEAERANLAKSRFMAAASHDLRQPLHALSLFTAALRERALAPEARGLVTHIESSVNALETLFNALLDISRLDAGVLQPEPRSFRLGPLCARIVNDYQPAAETKGLALEVLDCEVVVRSDPAMLEQILRNLLANAIRYTDAGSVRLGCFPAGGAVRIEVADTGRGIPVDRQREIFREFHQLGNPERDRAKGLGLGLAIVERLARLLGTRVALDSVPGRGSIFSVLVPVAERADPEPQRLRSVEAGDELAGMRVAVVDDEAEVREGMRALLGSWGCEVVAGRGVDELLSGLQGGRSPDAVVADLRLPGGGSGIDAVERLRERLGGGVPTLITTGDTAPERLREVEQRGYALLHKPVPPARLRAFLRHARRQGPARPAARPVSPPGAG